MNFSTSEDGDKKRNIKLNFSHVDSQQKAEELVRSGKLEKILLFPAEFGGPESSDNIVYVPVGIGAIKDRITGTITNLYKKELIDDLTINPAYNENSIVPSRIGIKTSKDSQPAKFNTTIEIW